MSEDKFEYISKSWFYEVVMKNNDAISDTVREDMAVVNGIDKQIVSLIKQRNYMLYGLNCKCLKSRNADVIFGGNPIKMWKAYKKEGFKSQIVKDTVSSIRAVFFDDDKEKYQKFFCAHIIHEEYGYGSDSLSFAFEDSDGHKMRLVFDVKPYEHDYLYKAKMLNGCIYFSVKEGRDYTTVEASVSIRDIKAAIEKWIDSGFVAEAYKFEHGSLVDKCSDIFKEFEHMRAYDVYYATHTNATGYDDDDVKF